MNTSPPIDDAAGAGAQPPDDEVLAGELVLGVLDSEQRRRMQQRAANDAQFAARVTHWENQLAPWLAQIAPVSAPAHLWPRIAARLGWSERTQRPGLWQSIVLWRTATVVAVLAAVGIWLVRPAPRPEAALTRAVTTLAQANGTPGWLASVDPARGTVLMVPVPRAADAQGRVPELWIIPPGEAPRSLGAVSINRSHTVTVPAEDRMALNEPGAVLAITLEPSAGVPHRAPSGPVIAQGAIQG
jgi:anti-sigma-K factor RskA